MGISDLGGGVTWGEALLLVEEASSDTSTALGAELAGWAYPAGMRDLLTLVAQIGNVKAARKVMPWVLEVPGRKATTPQASADDIAAAEAQLENDFVFD